jgi:hypothetical protein
MSHRGPEPQPMGCWFPLVLGCLSWVPIIIAIVYAIRRWL